MYAAIAAVASVIAAQESVYGYKHIYPQNAVQISNQQDWANQYMQQPVEYTQAEKQAILQQQAQQQAQQIPQQPIVLDVESVEDEPAPTGLDALMALLKKNQETASSV
jgi:hypothetical protein